MTESMVERVALAIWADRYPDEEWNVYDKVDYLGHARAAIEAMRVPTDQQRSNYFEMKRAAGHTEINSVFLDADWERSIDAALAEPKE